ncbi:JAB domain-containing protein [Pedobacter helvus]|uniref:JAB domain-containing protein n=1 Tax=Pedobacter helvus TaxID=2563444 RepID=A0ABW9JQ50_9SPHI
MVKQHQSLTVHDHLIVTENSYFSMAEEGLM